MLGGLIEGLVFKVVLIWLGLQLLLNEVPTVHFLIICGIVLGAVLVIALTCLLVLGARRNTNLENKCVSASDVEMTLVNQAAVNNDPAPPVEDQCQVLQTAGGRQVVTLSRPKTAPASGHSAAEESDGHLTVLQVGLGVSPSVASFDDEWAEIDAMVHSTEYIFTAQGGTTVEDLNTAPPEDEELYTDMVSPTSSDDIYTDLDQLKEAANASLSAECTTAEDEIYADCEVVAMVTSDVAMVTGDAAMVTDEGYAEDDYSYFKQLPPPIPYDTPPSLP